MNATPTVSVVIPSHNRAHLLHRAIGSVLAQEYPLWECLVVDDGSTDRTKEAVESIHDERIRYIDHATNLGAAAARNTGIREARGTYVAFLDSDDDWLRDKLQRQVELFDSSPIDPGATYTWAEEVFGEFERTELTQPRLRGDVFQDLLIRQHLNFSSVMVRVHLARSIRGFDETMPCGEDRDFLVRLARVTKFDGVHSVLTRSYHGHGEHLNGDMNRLTAYRQRFIEKIEAMPEVPRSALAYHHRSLSKLMLIQGNHGGAVRESLRAFVSRPLDVKCQWSVARSCAAYLRDAIAFKRTAVERVPSD